MVLLFLIYCNMYFPLFVGVLRLSLFWYAFLYVLSSFAIISKRKRELVALLLLSYIFLLTVNVLWLFLTVPWVGLPCVIVVFPDHTHFFSVWTQIRKCQARFGSNLLDTQMVILKYFFFTKLIRKRKIADDKKHENFSRGAKS